jgi:hypothetical protein
MGEKKRNFLNLNFTINIFVYLFKILMLPFIIIIIYQNDIVVLNNDCGSNSRQVSAKSMAINPRHVCHN